MLIRPSPTFWSIFWGGDVILLGLLVSFWVLFLSFSGLILRFFLGFWDFVFITKSKIGFFNLSKNRVFILRKYILIFFSEMILDVFQLFVRRRTVEVLRLTVLGYFLYLGSIALGVFWFFCFFSLD